MGFVKIDKENKGVLRASRFRKLVSSIIKNLSPEDEQEVFETITQFSKVQETTHTDTSQKMVGAGETEISFEKFNILVEAY